MSALAVDGSPFVSIGIVKLLGDAATKTWQPSALKGIWKCTIDRSLTEAVEE